MVRNEETCKSKGEERRDARKKEGLSFFGTANARFWDEWMGKTDGIRSRITV